jgi:hypothetical protein
VTLGEPISISEEGGATPVFRSKVAAPMAAGAQVAPGEETLSVTVDMHEDQKLDGEGVGAAQMGRQ